MYPPDRLLSTPCLLPLSIGSLYSGTYVMHELGLGPGSCLYQGRSVVRRGVNQVDGFLENIFLPRRTIVGQWWNLYLLELLESVINMTEHSSLR